MKRYFICNPGDIPPQPLDTDDPDTVNAKHAARGLIGNYHYVDLDSHGGPTKCAVVLMNEMSTPPDIWESMPHIMDPDTRLSGTHVQYLSCIGVKPGHMTFHAAKILGDIHLHFKP